MAKDRDMISKEDHELNYVLSKWNKRQTKGNREILAKALTDFKKDAKFKPHNRENFYKYCTSKKVKGKLESKK